MKITPLQFLALVLLDALILTAPAWADVCVVGNGTVTGIECLMPPNTPHVIYNGGLGYGTAIKNGSPTKVYQAQCYIYNGMKTPTSGLPYYTGAATESLSYLNYRLNGGAP